MTAEPVNTSLFWKSIAERCPSLTKQANVWINATTSSCDAERSHSMYKLINASNRQRASKDLIRQELFLYFNGCIQREVEELLPGEREIISLDEPGPSTM